MSNLFARSLGMSLNALSLVSLWGVCGICDMVNCLMGVCVHDVVNCSTTVDILALSGWPALAFIITTGGYGYGYGNGDYWE